MRRHPLLFFGFLPSFMQIQAHLNDFNLTQEYGTYGRIKGLSGGQKVKLVLAAAFWTVPHILVSALLEAAPSPWVGHG
jgi:ATPase subunit of ABC transporter with duplicated ATPase domains